MKETKQVKELKEMLRKYLALDAEWAKVDPVGFKAERDKLDVEAKRLLK